MLPPGPVSGKTDVEHISKALLPVDALAETLKQLNIGLDVHAFIDLVAQKAVTNSALSSTQKTRKDVHKAAVASLMHSYPVPPPTNSVVRHVQPASVSTADREKRRKMLAATRAAFQNKVPDPYVACWAGNFENLQFIQAEITLISEDESDIQTFSEWCLWDTGAQFPMIFSSRVNDDIKGGPNAPAEGFLQMEILFNGVQNPRINCSISYRPTLPNQFIILGQRTLMDYIEYSVTPKVFDANIPMTETTYGAMEPARYYDPVDGAEQPFS